jgi:hypothetical protein
MAQRFWEGEEKDTLQTPFPKIKINLFPDWPHFY